ncbi:hypothetical protein FRC06_008477 [Ceratobasidium sp. 370]|nr:hypothetical protein FRC06_008477 [Ceratobasidium sp. 370]
MSHVSAGSEGYTASEICRCEDKFSVWAKEVPAVYRPRLWDRTSSGLVTDMVQASECLPEWLFNKDSSEYKMFGKLYPRDAQHLVIPNMGSKKSSDSSAATDLIYAMPHIIHVVRRHIALRQGNELAFNEADLRQPLDRLACHVWESDSKEMFRFRSECLLKLPQTNTFPIPKAIVDSVSCFIDSNPECTLLKTDSITAEGMRCTVNPNYSLALLHWVTEYKSEASRLPEVERQVYYGIVSGLWQRRILGRIDDYVFGTAHAGSDLIVYAARWEKRSTNSSNEEADSDPKPKSPAPVAARSDTSNKSLKVLATQDGGSNTGKAQPDSELTPGLTKDDHEIVVYKLKQFSTGKLLHMVQFYLLMRASRQLADTYRAQIFGEGWPALLAEVETRLQFNWSPLAPPHSTSKSNSEDIPEDSNTGEDLAEVLVVGCNADMRWAYEAASPEQEAEWKEKWERQRQSAVQQCGPGSLTDFEPVEVDTEGLDLNGRVSTYLDSLH